jgi:F1F0 ATPase subunit 2
MRAEITAYCIAVAEGVLLSGFFFGVLLLTIQKGLTARHPGLWFAASFLLRMGVVTFAFFWFSNGQWRLLLFCLAGFLAGRCLFVRSGGKKADPGQSPDGAVSRGSEENPDRVQPFYDRQGG